MMYAFKDCCDFDLVNYFIKSRTP